ncbi:phage-related minor tail protein [Paraburkholderia eburnea]|uniref:Phage-related minor tail protein n=1 Tax=Paraburkholderia eburnea TaxID=1189126 RepID=A0A2S4LXE8_9BURK|nr:phage tail length tape measure family protein [Paraburkholderia eburnea]POR47055.1 phage-related minor tail protein [Paraburkholderia eburnea]PRZ18285.1 phage-related minor tail protein [Paraburkholderia eburnea]
MSLGSLVLELQGNVARTQEDMGRLQQIVESAMRRMDAAASRTSDNIQGVATAGRAIQRVQGAEEAAASIERVGHASVGARREMLVLAHELATGNFKRAAGSLMVLGERIDIMSKLASPAGIAIAGLTAAVAGFAAMVIKGAMESAQFARSIMLTSNYAGQTEASYNRLSRSVADATGATIGNAREITQALISSGRISSGALESVALAATRLQVATGQNAQEIVRQFAGMSDGVLKWALDANRQYHFVDGALYDHIKALEQAGQQEKAMEVASTALYQHLGNAATENLGYIERAWRGVKSAISDAADALMSVGRAETAAETAARINRTLAAKRSGQTDTSYALGVGEGLGGLEAGGSYDDLTRQQSAATSLARRQQDAASLAAYKAHTDEMVVAAKTRWDELSKAHKVGAERLKEELDEAARVGQQAGASRTDIAAMQERIRKEYSHGSGAGLDRANLDAQTQPIQEQITSQSRLLQDRQKQLELAYRDDHISEQAYYDQSKAAIEQYNAQIRTLYDQQITIVEGAAKRTADARTRVTLTNRANALRNDEQQALLQSSERLSELTERQTEDTRKYRDEVEKLNSELGKLDRDPGRTAGADFDREHGHLQREATLSGDTDTLATLAQARNAAVAQAQMNSLKQEAEQITQRLTLAEKELAVAQETGEKGAVAGMIELGQLRQQAAQQLAQIQQQMQGIASNSGLPQLDLQAQQFGLQVQQLSASSNVLGKSISDVFANSFANMLDNTITRTKTLRQEFLDMANSIEQAIMRIIAQDLTNQLFGIGSGTGSGSSSGGWLGQLFSWGMGLLGLTGGSATSFSTDVMQSGLMGLTPDFSVAADDIGSMLTYPFHMASGGDTSPGGLYEVNEKGPELLTVANRTFLMMGNQGGTVTPGGSSGPARGGHTFNLNIAVPPGTTRQSAQQQAQAIMRQTNIAMARNG